MNREEPASTGVRAAGELYLYGMKRSACLFAALLVATALPRPPGFLHPYHAALALLGVGAALLAVLQAVRPPQGGGVGRTAAAGLVLLALGLLAGLFTVERPLTAALDLAGKWAALIFLLAGIAVLRDEDGRRILRRGVTVALLIHTLAGGADLLFFPGGDGIRGTLGHPNVYAYHLVVLWPWALATAVDERRWWRHLGFFVTVAVLLLLPWTRSAGAMLGLLAGAMGVFWARARGTLRRWRPAVLAVSLLLAAGMFLFLSLRREVAWVDRTANLAAGVRLFREAPLTGHGPGQVRFLFPAARSPHHPHYADLTALGPLDHLHLQPLQAAVEGGLFAALGLLLFAAAALAAAWRALARGSGMDRGFVAWMSLSAAVVQGAVSLAPSREGMLPAALAFAAALSLSPAFKGGKTPRPGPRRAFWALLAVVALAALPLQVRRAAADAALKRGRDPARYWAPSDARALQRSLSLWPEGLEARALLVWARYREAFAEPEGSPARRRGLEDALAQSDTLAALAPSFFKLPLHRARILAALGRWEAARVELLESPFFHGDREREDLLEELNRKIESRARGGPAR